MPIDDGHPARRDGDAEGTARPAPHDRRTDDPWTPIPVSSGERADGPRTPERAPYGSRIDGPSTPESALYARPIDGRWTAEPASYGGRAGDPWTPQPALYEGPIDGPWTPESAPAVELGSLLAGLRPPDEPPLRDVVGIAMADGGRIRRRRRIRTAAGSALAAACLIGAVPLLAVSAGEDSTTTGPAGGGSVGETVTIGPPTGAFPARVLPADVRARLDALRQAAARNPAAERHVILDPADGRVLLQARRLETAPELPATATGEGVCAMLNSGAPPEPGGFRTRCTLLRTGTAPSTIWAFETSTGHGVALLQPGGPGVELLSDRDTPGLLAALATDPELPRILTGG